MAGRGPKGAGHSAFQKHDYGTTADMEHVLGPMGNRRQEGLEQIGKNEAPRVSDKDRPGGQPTPYEQNEKQRSNA